MRNLWEYSEGRIAAWRTNYRRVLVESREAVDRQHRRIARQLGQPAADVVARYPPEEDVLGRLFLVDYVGGVRCPDVATHGGVLPIVAMGDSYPDMVVPFATCKKCEHLRSDGRYYCQLRREEHAAWRSYPAAPSA
jgi:hypothetical protein